ncbi:MAG: glycosyltransferase family 4 protein [Ancrocorticia sp.]
MNVVVQALRQRGHTVTVLASDESLREGTTEADEKVLYFHTSPLGDKSLAHRVRNALGSYRASVAMAKRFPPADLVLCTSPPLLLVPAAMRIARRMGAPLVLDVRDIWPEIGFQMGSFSKRSVYGRVFSLIARCAYRQAELVTTVSPSKAEYLRSRLGLASKVELIPNGLDLAFLEQSENPELVRRHNIDLQPTCVYAGNIGLAQGLGTLLDIANERRDVQFLLCGDGAEKARLEARVRQESLSNVKFLGTLGASDVFTLLKHATLSYIPLISSQLQDSVPTKIFEALGCGCPVLLCAEGDAATIVQESGLGIAVPPEDSERILEAFNRMVARRWTTTERSAAAEFIRTRHSRQEPAKRLAETIEDRWGVRVP